jgi:long-chain fatty acid transport protein
MKTTLLTTLGLGVFAGVASANGFNINEHDAQVTGRGGATVASIDGASSIVFNPAGLARVTGTMISFGGSMYIAQGSYTPEGGTETTTDSDPSIVPNLYVAKRMDKRFAAGLGLHLPFGLAVSWPDAHAQRDIVMDQKLRTYFISPVIAVNLDQYAPGLSVAVGADIVPATIELKQDVLFGDTVGNVVLAGDTIGFGLRAGVQYHAPAVKGLKVGVMYRSPIELDFSGTGDFDIEDPFRSQLPPDGPITAGITLPQTVWGGVAYSPVNNLEVEVDAVWINWAQAFEDGDLTINFTDADVSTSQPQDYENTISYRLGVDYFLAPQKLNLRAGFVYDPTPIPTTTLSARLPDIDRKNVTLGASKAFGNYGAHLGVLWVTPGERETSDADPYAPQFKATYGVQAFVISLGMTGRFGSTGAPAVPATGDGALASR